MDAEMTAFASDVLESIKQAKHYESAHDSFIKRLIASPKTPIETTDESDTKRLDIQPRSMDLGDSANN